MIIDETVVNPPCPTCERPGRHAKGDRFVCTACVTTWVVRGWSTAIMKGQLEQLMHELNIGSITTFVGTVKNCAECGTEFPKNTFGNYTGHRVTFGTYRMSYYCKNCVSNLKLTPLRQFEKGDYVKTRTNIIARIVGFNYTSYCPILQTKGSPHLIFVPSDGHFLTWYLEEFTDLPHISPDGILETMNYRTGKMTRWGLVAQEDKIADYHYALDILNHTIILKKETSYSVFTREEIEALIDGGELPGFEFNQAEIDELAVMFGLKEAEDAKDDVCNN